MNSCERDGNLRRWYGSHDERVERDEVTSTQRRRPNRPSKQAPRERPVTGKRCNSVSLPSFCVLSLLLYVQRMRQQEFSLLSFWVLAFISRTISTNMSSTFWFVFADVSMKGAPHVSASDRDSAVVTCRCRSKSLLLPTRITGTRTWPERGRRRNELVGWRVR